MRHGVDGHRQADNRTPADSRTADVDLLPAYRDRFLRRVRDNTADRDDAGNQAGRNRFDGLRDETAIFRITGRDANGYADDQRRIELRGLNVHDLSVNNQRGRVSGLNRAVEFDRSIALRKKECWDHQEEQGGSDRQSARHMLVIPL